MSTIVISIGSFRDVHEIDVTTTKGRRCTIDIYKNNSGFDSEVTILDSISSASGSWVYNTEPTSDSAIDNFDAAIELIKKYLSNVEPQDSITDVHNPCNTPCRRSRSDRAPRVYPWMNEPYVCILRAWKLEFQHMVYIDFNITSFG